jgi:hypothetical protein
MKPYIPPILKKDPVFAGLSQSLTMAILTQMNWFKKDAGDPHGSFDGFSVSCGRKFERK